MPEAPHLTELTGEYQCLHEFIPAARAKLDSNIWGYLIGATESETTLRRNRAALDAIALRPRVLRDVSKVDATTTLPGHEAAAAGDAGAGRLAGIVRSRRCRDRRPWRHRIRRADHRQLGDQAWT